MSRKAVEMRHVGCSKSAMVVRRTVIVIYTIEIRRRTGQIEEISRMYMFYGYTDNGGNSERNCGRIMHFRRVICLIPLTLEVRYIVYRKSFNKILECYPRLTYKLNRIP